jgi:hypothetical protein
MFASVPAKKNAVSAMWKVSIIIPEESISWEDVTATSPRVKVAYTRRD